MKVFTQILLTGMLALALVACSKNRAELAATQTAPSAQSAFSHKALDELLGQYVNKDGWVDYPGLKNDRAKLGEYLATLATAKPQSFPNDAERLAFWINSYNAFTLADVIAYVQAALDADLSVDDFAPRLAFFFNAHNNFLEEVAKYRAARRLWARVMRDRFGAKDAKSQMLRFHTQTAGSTLTAQQPEVNVIRTTIQALAAVLGGTQSLHTNAMDEALSLPTADAARIALRTQQVIAYESGVADTADPLAGSYVIEHLTNEIEARAAEYIAKIDEQGGMLAAIEAGFAGRYLFRLEVKSTVMSCALPLAALVLSVWATRSWGFLNTVAVSSFIYFAALALSLRRQQMFSD